MNQKELNKNGNRPDFEVFVTHEKQWVKIGAAWKNRKDGLNVKYLTPNGPVSLVLLPYNHETKEKND